jgi:hypothetical protein
VPILNSERTPLHRTYSQVRVWEHFLALRTYHILRWGKSTWKEAWKYERCQTSKSFSVCTSCKLDLEGFFGVCHSEERARNGIARTIIKLQL